MSYRERPSHPHRDEPYRSRGDREPLEKRDPEESRTLFMRNLPYDLEEEELLALLRVHGELSRTFNMLPRKGMYFASYYDLRHAIAAKRAMHEQPLRGRPLDMHFALPKGREEDGEEEINGILVVTVEGQVRGEVPRFDRDELRRHMAQFGDVRGCRDSRTPNAKFVEYWDLRVARRVAQEQNNKEWREWRLRIKHSAPRLPDRGDRGDRGGDRGGTRDRDRDRDYQREGRDREREREREWDRPPLPSSPLDPLAALLAQAASNPSLLAQLVGALQTAPQPPPTPLPPLGYGGVPFLIQPQAQATHAPQTPQGPQTPQFPPSLLHYLQQSNAPAPPPTPTQPNPPTTSLAALQLQLAQLAQLQGQHQAPQPQPTPPPQPQPQAQPQPTPLQQLMAQLQQAQQMQQGQAQSNPRYGY